MISVVIPTCNSEKTIKRCLDSIVEQTYPEWEVLLMDGVSKDDTLSIARSYNDSRIRIYSEPDKGIYDAMNKGIMKSKGEWLYFLGSDDFLCNKEVLKIVSTHFQDIDVVYGEVESDYGCMVEENRGQWTFENILANRCHQAIFYRRAVFAKVGLYDLRYRVWADWDLNHRWYCCPSIRHQYISEKIAHYSEGGFSSNQGDEAFDKVMAYNLLVKGRHVFTIAQRRKLADEALCHFTKRELKYYIVRGYIYYLRVLKKLGRI